MRRNGITFMYRRRFTAQLNLTRLIHTLWTVVMSGLFLGAVSVAAQAPTWDTLTEAGLQAFERGDYAASLQQFQAALTLAETLPAKDPRVSVSLMNVAAVYHRQERYAEAEPFYQRALANREQALGPHHPQLVEILQGYASLLRGMSPWRSLLPGSPAHQLESRARDIEEREKGGGGVLTGSWSDDGLRRYEDLGP